MREITSDRIRFFIRTLFVFFIFFGNDSVFGLSDTHLHVMHRYSDLDTITEDFSEADLEKLFETEKQKGNTGLTIDLPEPSLDIKGPPTSGSIRSKIYKIARKTKMLVSFKQKKESSTISFSNELFYPGFIPKKSSKARLNEIFQQASENGYAGIYIDLPENANFLEPNSRDFKFYRLLLETAAENSMHVATLPLQKPQKARLMESIDNFEIAKSEIHPRSLYNSVWF